MKQFAPVSLILAALIFAAGCGDDPVKSSGSDPLMTITVVDTAGNPVPGLIIGSMNHSDYIRRPTPPPQSLPTVQISFSLPQQDSVWLTVLNYYGDLVATLIDGQIYDAGMFAVNWSPGDTIKSGFYRYHIVSGSFTDDHWVIVDLIDAVQTVFGETDAAGQFVSDDTLLFPCLLGDPPPIEIRDQYGNLLTTVDDFYNDTITVHLSDPAKPYEYYYYDRAVQPEPNHIELIWTH